ncbi:hypothetical protein DRW07_01825 [Alteromonas sediminis]|uniref:VWA domain-containing protein n=1 Tax=Alteromonas sediminis TaxID=2259342 RepID=A0A3N5Y2Y0_9ALTE|nr:hypothetical protein [Alteromonas sediminis]RPJ68172.1 hypothetical protein DRW07_01825 [Alteromonas sediminis]
MKKTRAPIALFSLSFLDIISCAFGAVVMLILLAKNGDDGELSDVSSIAELIVQLDTLEQQRQSLEQQNTSTEQSLAALSASVLRSRDQLQVLESELAQAQNEQRMLEDQASGLEQVLLERERAAIAVNQNERRDENVGGIPVDSNFVVFVVDTSGSMKNMWPRVMQTMNDLLNTHPDVEGFQIISDNGDVLGGRRLGSWRQDSPTERRRALSQMRNWNGSSSSSPVEGIESALRVYRGKAGDLALYVLGDDYSGGSYDETLSAINKLNDAGNGNKIARIHGVGFKPNAFGLESTMMRFSTLMREVAHQNNGAFIAM